MRYQAEPGKEGNEGRSEAEPLDMRYQAEPGNEETREGGKRGKERGGASGYALPGRAWERGNEGRRETREGARRSLWICVTRQSLGTRDI